MDRFRRIGAPIAVTASGAIDIDMPEDARVVCTHMLLDCLMTGTSNDAASQVADGGVLAILGGGANTHLANAAQGINYRAAGGNPIIPGIHFRFLRYLAECLGSNPDLVEGPGFMEWKGGYAAAVPSVVPYNQALDGTGLEVAHKVRAHVPFYHIVRGGNWSPSLPLVATGAGPQLDISKAPGFSSLLDAQAVSSLDFTGVFSPFALLPQTTEGAGGWIEADGAGTLAMTGRGFSVSIHEALDMPPARYLFSRLIKEIRVNPTASGTVTFDLREAKGSILMGVMLVVLDDDADARDPNITRLSDHFVSEVTLKVGGKEVSTLDFAEVQSIGRSAMGVSPWYHRPGVAFVPLNGDGAIRGAQDLSGPNPGNVTLELATNAAAGGGLAPLIACIGVLLDPNPPAVGV